MVILESNSMESDEETTVEIESNNNNEKQPQAKRPRIGKKRSKIWNEFVEEPLQEGLRPKDVKARCLHCGNKYLCHSKKYGVHSLKIHLTVCKVYLAKQSDGQTKITFEQGDGDVNKMTAWKFDQKESKKALGHVIIADELPFSFVEGGGFRHFSRINQLSFRVPCRGTITQVCLKLFFDEKNKLRELIQRNIGRVCLTTDSWTSIKKRSYMALTAHFVDNEWNLQKKVLNFCRLDGHGAIDIGKGVESCLNEWEIEFFLSISVDNASTNDGAIDFMKFILENNKNTLLKGKWIHIRCAAHIVNLVVQDGIKKVGKSIDNIRYAVKWVKKSGARIEKFRKCAESAKCASNNELVLNCPTKWNSTYNMLEVAEPYEQAFMRYDLEDVNFGIHLKKKGHSVPTSEDWKKARKLSHFLKTFYEVTLRISGTKYVTSHTLVVELAKIRDLLRQQIDCDIVDEAPNDQYLYDIAKVMKPKFDKYYSEIENMNLLVYFSFILDPRNKYAFLNIAVDDHYGREGISIVEKKIKHIKDELELLYNFYVRINAPTSTTSSMLGKMSYPTNTLTHPDHGDRLRNKMITGQTSNASVSELSKYFDESVEAFDSDVNFDILTWWKVNSPRFSILSLMARDLFAIPISTVASESVFSTSGRVLDAYRSSLGDKTIECLICTQDWLRISVNPEKEED